MIYLRFSHPSSLQSTLLHSLSLSASLPLSLSLSLSLSLPLSLTLTLSLSLSPSHLSSPRDVDYDEFERMLHGLTVSRALIKAAMGFAFDKVESAKEVRCGVAWSPICYTACTFYYFYKMFVTGRPYLFHIYFFSYIYVLSILVL